MPCPTCDNTGRVRVRNVHRVDVGTKWARTVVDELVEVDCPDCEDTMSGTTESYAQAIVRLEAENARLREALEAIVRHQESIGGGLAVLSATRRIAQQALNDQDAPTASTPQGEEPQGATDRSGL